MANRGIKLSWRQRLLRPLTAARYSWQGVQSAYRDEAAFREEVWIGVPAIIVVWFLPLPAGWQVAMVASILLLWIVEIANTAIEAVVDIASPQQNLLARKAKDCGSAAVLLALLIVVLVWAFGISFWQS